MNTDSRFFATPLSTGAFLLSLLTGLLFLFSLVAGMSPTSLAWASVLFLAAFTFNAAVNWKQFT